jgi:hypothetical protein
MSDAVRNPTRGHRAALRQVLPRLVLGSGLAGAGLLFTLDNLDVLEAGDYLQYWPALLIAFGAGLLFAGTRSERASGTFWGLVGAALLLDNLEVIRFSLWDLWPLMLVIAGGMLVFRSIRPRIGGTPAGEEATLHAFAMMSGVARKNNSLGFQGGTVTAIMGGVEVDLRGTSLAGGQATLDTFAFWGGIEITIPPGWTVQAQVLPIMGGVEDKTSPPAPEDATGELILTGTVIMGGVAVKN